MISDQLLDEQMNFLNKRSKDALCLGIIDGMHTRAECMDANVCV